MAIVAQLAPAWDGSSRAQLASAWAEEAAPPIVIPTIAATNAHVVSLSTGQVYYSKGTLANEDRPASLTKLMTVLVLLDYKPTMAALSQTVTIQASDQVGGSGNNLLNGDVITLHALMMNALLPSSNSAATAIARTVGQELLNAETGGVGDPVARFVTAMNDKAVALGRTDTTFFNPSGLGHDHITSPETINAVSRSLWNIGIVRTAWTYKTYSMPLVRSGTPTNVTITTTNLMFDDSGIVGGKTGTVLSPNTYNLNLLWRANTRDVVAFSIFGSTSDAQRYTDMRALVAALKVDYPEVLGAAVAPTGTLTLGTHSVTSSSISLPWTYSAADHDGIEYRYRLTAGTWSAWIDAGLVSPIEIAGLTSGAEYEIEARAYNPAGTGTPQTVTVTVGAADITGTLAAQESGADTAAITGAVLVSGALSVTESGADTAIIIGGNILAGYMAAQEAGSDTAAASGTIVVSGALDASEAGADGFAASGSIGSSDVIGNVAALESGADSIVVSGVVIVSGSMAAAEAGSDTMQTDNGEWYPSSRTISVPSGRTITLRPR